MATDFFISDPTSVPSGYLAGDTGLDLADQVAAMELLRTGPSGSSSETISLEPNNTWVGLIYESEAGYPNRGVWPVDLIEVHYRFTSGPSSDGMVEVDSVYVYRVDSESGALTRIGATTGVYVPIPAAGLASRVNVPTVQSVGGLDDRLYVIVSLRSLNTSADEEVDAAPPTSTLTFSALVADQAALAKNARGGAVGSATCTSEADAVADASGDAVSAATTGGEADAVVDASGAGQAVATGEATAESVGDPTGAAVGSATFTPGAAESLGDALGGAVGSAVAGSTAETVADALGAGEGSATGGGTADIAPEAIGAGYEALADAVRGMVESGLGGRGAEIHYEAFPWLGAEVEGQPLLALALEWAPELRIHVGTRVGTYRKRGTAVVTVRTDMHSGHEVSLQRVDAVMAALRSVELQGVHFAGAATVARRGRRERWSEVDVRVPFYFDETATLAAQAQDGAMPTHEEAADTLRSRFETLVATPESLTVVYDNFPDDHPDNEPWVRLSFNAGSSNQASTFHGGGLKRFRNIGAATALIGTPIHTGHERALQLVDVIVSAFRAVAESGITFRTPEVGAGYRSQDGKWWQVPVAINYWTEEVA